MRRVWIALGALAVAGMLAVLGLNLWVQSYLRSEAFRRLVAAKTGQALQAETDIGPLDWSGSSVFSAELNARGAAVSPVAALTAEQVRATVDWRGIFDGAWRVNRIDVVRLDARLQAPSRPAGAGSEEAVPPPEPPPKRGWLPNRFELQRVSVQDANVSVGPLGKLRNVELTVRPEDRGWIFDGAGGRLEMPGWAPLEVGSFRLRLQEGVTYVTDAALRLGANGAIDLSGEIGGKRGPFELLARWRNVDAADVLGAAWKSRVTGTLSGEATSVGRPGGAAVTTGKFRLADGRLEALPVQKQIALFTRSPQFERLPLREVSGDFRTDGVTTSVTNFVAESPALVRVEGAFQVGAGGSLDGRFRIGVTTQTLQWLPGSQEKVFVTAEGGYLWTDVKIGGTVDQPTEDLSGRLARATGEKVIETGVQVLQGGPDNATDAIQKGLDLLTPLIP